MNYSSVELTLDSKMLVLWGASSESGLREGCPPLGSLAAEEGCGKFPGTWHVGASLWSTGTSPRFLLSKHRVYPDSQGQESAVLSSYYKWSWEPAWTPDKTGLIERGEIKSAGLDFRGHYLEKAGHLLKPNFQENVKSHSGPNSLS